jgi:LPPG:FO 2-phospho-L-lactate transferase
MGTVVAIGGQGGGARLAQGLYRLRGHKLAAIVNTGDDFSFLGLAFSPDLDTMLYALAGIESDISAWEPEGETRAMQGMLKTLGGPDRPPLGDRALAAALLRSEGLANERGLTEITLGFCRNLGISARVLPMSDDPVRTHMLTPAGAVSSHEYFHQLGGEPPVHGFQYAGAEEARLSDEVLDALHASDLEAVVICPANAYYTVQPILAVRGMRELLRKRGAPVVAVTPIVGDKARNSSAGKMMRELGREPSPRSIAGEYLRLVDGFVLDSKDSAYAEGIRSFGMQALVAPTVMRNLDDRVSLARTVLDFAASIRKTRALEVE